MIFRMRRKFEFDFRLINCVRLYSAEPFLWKGGVIASQIAPSRRTLFANVMRRKGWKKNIFSFPFHVLSEPISLRWSNLGCRGSRSDLDLSKENFMPDLPILSSMGVMSTYIHNPDLDNSIFKFDRDTWWQSGLKAGPDAAVRPQATKPGALTRKCWKKELVGPASVGLAGWFVADAGLQWV